MDTRLHRSTPTQFTNTKDVFTRKDYVKFKPKTITIDTGLFFTTLHLISKVFFMTKIESYLGKKLSNCLSVPSENLWIL